VDGKWYVYYTATNSATPVMSRRTWVLECTGNDPWEGPWLEKGKIAAEPDYWAIDGSILEANGNCYFIWSGWEEGTRQEAQNIYIALMENPWTISGRRVLISKPEYPWETRPPPGSNVLVNEGPQAMETENYYAIVYSASHYNSEDYCLGILRLRKGQDLLVASNWEKHPEPLFSGSAQSGIWSPGHHSFFTSPDGSERWFAYHAYTSPWSASNGYGNARRHSFALPYTLGKNEIPVFGVPVSSGSFSRAPSGEEN
jgi:GH43 family beta-xylosidase